MMTAVPAVVGILAVFISSVNAGPETQTVPSDDLGAQVVEFCRTHLGQKVGNGQCGTLASEALGAVHAHKRGRDWPEKADYTWGNLALVVTGPTGNSKTPKYSQGSLADLRPGDIIQYRGTQWVHHDAKGKVTSWGDAEHHTSVISSLEDGGKTIHVYQQNSRGRLFVVEGLLRLDDMTAGWLWIYHPVPKSQRVVVPEVEPKDQASIPFPDGYDADRAKQVKSVLQAGKFTFLGTDIWNSDLGPAPDAVLVYGGDSSSLSAFVGELNQIAGIKVRLTFSADLLKEAGNAELPESWWVEYSRATPDTITVRVNLAAEDLGRSKFELVLPKAQ